LNLCASRGLPDVARGLNGKIWLPMNDTGYTFVIVLVIVWYLFWLVSRDRLIASGDPSKVFLVIGIGRIKWDEGVIRQALNCISSSQFIHL
jgi:hypothetical protein